MFRSEHEHVSLIMCVLFKQASDSVEHKNPRDSLSHRLQSPAAHNEVFIEHYS